MPTMRMILTEISFIANLVGSDNDLLELMALAAADRVVLRGTTRLLADVNTAMDDLIAGRLHGRGTLVP